MSLGILLSWGFSNMTQESLTVWCDPGHSVRSFMLVTYKLEKLVRSQLKKNVELQRLGWQVVMVVKKKTEKVTYLISGLIRDLHSNIFNVFISWENVSTQF